MGAGGRNAVGTLGERSPRYVLHLQPPNGEGPSRSRRWWRRRMPLCPQISPRRSRAIRATRCLTTLRSASPLASRPLPVIHTHPDTKGRTRTPTGFAAKICPRAPTCRSRQLRTWSGSNGARTAGFARHVNPWHHLRVSRRSLRSPV